jgi:hypothetical protein
MRVGRKDCGAGNQLLSGNPREILPARFSLSDGCISSCVHKLRKLGIGNICLIHPEAIDIDAVDGSGICHRLVATLGKQAWILAAHGELAARNPHHAHRMVLGRRYSIH